MKKPPFVTEYSAPESTRSLLRRVRFVKDAPQRTRLDWATRLDDAIAAALAHTVWVREDYTTNATEIRARLYLRGLKAAERDGVCWNPILDGLARGRAGRKWELSAMATVISASPEQFTPFETQLEPLRRWLARQTDSRAIEPALLAFHSDIVLEHLATYGPIDIQLAQALLDRSHHLVSFLAENERLGSATASFIGDWAIGMIVGREGKQVSVYGTALEELDRRGIRAVTRSELEQLIAVATDTHIGHRDIFNSAERAMDALVRLRRHLTREDLKALIPAVTHRGTYITPLVTEAPAADESIVLLALGSSRSKKLRAGIAAHPDFSLLPRVRSQLVRSSDRDVVLSMLHTSKDPAERRQILHSVLKKRAHLALWILGDQPHLLDDLNVRDLAPALRSDVRSIRERAIMLLASLQRTMDSGRDPSRHDDRVPSSSGAMARRGA